MASILFPKRQLPHRYWYRAKKAEARPNRCCWQVLIGGLYDFIVATFGWWNENFTTRVCGFGEMLADKAKLVFKVNTGAAVLGLGYIVGLKYASIICCRFTGRMVDYRSGHVT